MFILPEGREISHTESGIKCCVTIRKRSALGKIFLDPLFAFPECYTRGEIEVDDLAVLLQEQLRLAESTPSKRGIRRLLPRILYFPRGSSIRQSRQI